MVDNSNTQSRNTLDDIFDEERRLTRPQPAQPRDEKSFAENISRDHLSATRPLRGAPSGDLENLYETAGSNNNGSRNPLPDWSKNLVRIPIEGGELELKRDDRGTLLAVKEYDTNGEVRNPRLENKSPAEQSQPALSSPKQGMF